MAWMHQFVDPTGRVKPCCRFSDIDRPKDNNLNEKTFEEIFYSDFMNEIRDKMMKGEQVSGCSRCYQEEASGKSSLRQRYNKMTNLHPDDLIHDLSEPEIRWLELAIGNDCNLACRMCDSRYAWKWFDDEKELFGKTWSKTQHTKSDIRSIDPLLDKIVHIKFTGGEPLIIPDHFALLEKLAARPSAHNMFLNYSTNLTIAPKRSTIELWKKFKYVELAVSFDGIEDTWELIRYPSSWKTAEKVTRQFFSLTHEFNCRIGLRSTVSVNNILNMPESLEWWFENWDKYANHESTVHSWINPTHLAVPEYLSTTVLPEQYKEKVATKLSKHNFTGVAKNSIESQINYMFSRDDSILLPKLKHYTEFLDKKRAQDFFKVNPELQGLFDGI